MTRPLSFFAQPQPVQITVEIFMEVYRISLYYLLSQISIDIIVDALWLSIAGLNGPVLIFKAHLIFLASLFIGNPEPRRFWQVKLAHRACTILLSGLQPANLRHGARHLIWLSYAPALLTGLLRRRENGRRRVH